MEGFLQNNEEDIAIDFKVLAPETDFREIYSLIPHAFTEEYADMSIGGTASIDAKVNGTYNKDLKLFPGYELKIDVLNGSVKYPTMPKTIKDIGASIHILNENGDPNLTSVEIPNFRFSMAQDRFDGRLLLKPLGEKDKSIDLGISCGINLKDWKNVLPLDHIKTLSGNIQSDIVIKAKHSDVKSKNYNKAIFAGNARMQSFTMEGDSIPSVTLNYASLDLHPSEMKLTGKGLTIDGSDADIELSILDPFKMIFEKSINGNLSSKSKKINLSEYPYRGNKTDASKSSFELPIMNLKFDSGIDQLLTKDYTGENLSISGTFIEDRIDIVEANGTLNGNAIEARGKLENINEFMDGSGFLEGELFLNSNAVDFNSFLRDKQVNPGTNNMIIPNRINLTINATVGKSNYGNWNLSEIGLSGAMRGGSLMVETFEAQTLGGKILGSGIYLTEQGKNPKLGFKLDLSNIGFKDAFKSIGTFRYLAPLAEYISGYFNTTLVMESELDHSFAPVLNTLDASGYLETLEGKISGFGPLSALGKKIGVDKLSEWAIRNSKNWFEVEDGMVE